MIAQLTDILRYSLETIGEDGGSPFPLITQGWIVQAAVYLVPSLPSTPVLSLRSLLSDGSVWHASHQLEAHWWTGTCNATASS